MGNSGLSQLTLEASTDPPRGGPFQPHPSQGLCSVDTPLPPGSSGEGSGTWRKDFYHFAFGTVLCTPGCAVRVLRGFCLGETWTTEYPNEKDHVCRGDLVSDVGVVPLPGTCLSFHPLSPSRVWGTEPRAGVSGPRLPSRSPWAPRHRPLPRAWSRSATCSLQPPRGNQGWDRAEGGEGRAEPRKGPVEKLFY